jgi:transposase-like protein
MGRAKTAAQRQECLDALRASGQTVNQWCNQNGLHRTTVYRWLRQEEKSQVVDAKSSIKIEKEALQGQPISLPKVKWLPVTEKHISLTNESNFPDGLQKPNTENPATKEIRIQIGKFIIITPDGFSRGTLKSVCEALLDIC